MNDNFQEGKQKLECDMHNDQIKKFIRVDRNCENSLHCCYCLDGLQHCQFMSIKKLFDIENQQNQYLNNWPPLEKEDEQNIQSQIKMLFEDDYLQLNNEIKVIQQSFEAMREKIIELIQSLEIKMHSRINLLTEEQQQIKQKYIEMTQQKNIIQIIKNNQFSLAQKDQAIVEIIKKCHEDSQANTLELKNKLKMLKDNACQQKINKSMERLYQSINMIAQSIGKEIDEYKDGQLEEIGEQELDDDVNTKIKILIDLISNKTNNLNSQFIQSLHQKLEESSILFEDLSFQNIFMNKDINQINFNHFSDQDMEQIYQIIKIFQIKHENNQLNNDEKVDKLISLISNKSNFCTDIFLQQLKMCLDKNSFIFQDLEIENIHEDNFHPIEFNVLNLEQMQDVQHLVNLISDIAQKNQIEQIRQKQSGVLQHFQKLVQFDSNIYDLFQKYPILEFSNYNTNLIPIDLIKSNYERSQFLKVDLSKIIITSDEGNHHQAYTNFILEKNQNYVFRIGYKVVDCYVGFGITSDSQKDSNFFSQGLAFRNRGGNYGMQKVIQGKNLTDCAVSDRYNYFEVRINLSNKYYQIADYPQYQHINCITDSTRIAENEQYRFMINIHGQPKAGDYIEIVEAYAVNEMPNW